MNRTRNPYLLMAAHMFFVAGFAIYMAATSPSLLWLIAAVPFALWTGSVGVMSVAYSMWPHRFPWLTARSKPAWKLRLPQMNRSADRLRQIGFVEIGVKEERTFLLGLQTRELWHPVHRTFASLTTSFAAHLVPQVSFITQGEDGRILYSGRAVAHRIRHLVARAGIGKSIEERFEDHLRALKGEELVPVSPPAPENQDYRDVGTPSQEELMQTRLDLCREWYVVSFASDEQFDEWQTDMHSDMVSA